MPSVQADPGSGVVMAVSDGSQYDGSQHAESAVAADTSHGEEGEDEDTDNDPEYDRHQ